MSIKKVYCITNLGLSYVGYLIEDNISLANDIKNCFKNTAGVSRYGLIYDPEYNSLGIHKWGYDLFTKEEWLSRGDTILSMKETYDVPLLWLPHVYSIKSFKELRKQIKG